MSSEAFDLINCFYDGIDLVVRELAEQIAAKDSRNKDGVVLIEKKHVELAGCKIINNLRNLFDNQSLPTDLEEKFQGMAKCFSTKSE